MRALIPSSSFNRWVLPVRLIGLATGLLGLSFVVVAAGATGIVLAVVGSLIWQAGTLLEKRSAEFRRLNGTPARDVMLTERIDVQNWVKVAKVRERFLDANEQTFFVTLRDGYESGIVLPAQLRAVSEEDARYLPVGQVAQAISDISSIREDDSLLAAFEEMARHRLLYLTVLSLSERLVGVVTSKDIASFSRDREPMSVGRWSDRMDRPSNEPRKARTVAIGSRKPNHLAAVAPTLLRR